MVRIDDNGIIRDITAEEEKQFTQILAPAIKPTIGDLKSELATYDYIGVKIATGVATKEEYAGQIAYCETLRKQIRMLENEQI